MLFCAAVHQGSALFTKTIHGKGRAGAIAQQPLQCGPVVCFDEHTGIHREAAVLVAQHLFGVTTLQQAPADKTQVSVKANLYSSYVATKGAQDATAQICLYLGHSGLVDSTGRVKDDARHLLKHPIDCAYVEVHNGGFHFQLNELIHFQKQGLAVTIVYMRNDIFHLGKSGDGPIYHCSTSQFDVLQLVRAYGGDGKRCATTGEFLDYYGHCLAENTGIRLIEVPCQQDSQYQCREIALLNLYIQFRNGNPDAQTRWQEVIRAR
jgi:hypothetical protein